MSRITRTFCRHCGEGQVNRPRGLCWTCYYAPGVRELYPPTSAAAIAGATGHAERHIVKGGLPAEPCRFNCGSAEKIAVMIGRAERFETVFHHLDTNESYPDDE